MKLTTDRYEASRGLFETAELLVPAAFKSSYVCPRIKKLGLDTSDVSNYRPVSNLKVISKLLEGLVTSQLTAYLADNKLLPDHQSVYRAFCLTETAIARVSLSGVLTALDSGVRRHSRTLPARPVRGIRHGRPFHPAPSSAVVIWAKRLSTCMV